MSDYLFKLWPVEDVSSHKVQLLTEGLRAAGVISAESTHWGDPAFLVGEGFGRCLGLSDAIPPQAFSEVRVEIKERDYGVEDGESDMETSERNNVVIFYEASDFIEQWAPLTNLLKQITGDEYKGSWEIL